jgi:hypothetical protein
MQENSNFENLQFGKNTKFSKFSQNLSFYYRDLRPKKKLLQFSQRITLAGIGEPMVPDREMTGCFRKYLPDGSISQDCIFSKTFLLSCTQWCPSPNWVKRDQNKNMISQSNSQSLT